MRRHVGVMLALLVAVGGCTWGQSYGNAGRAGWNRSAGITAETVSSLHALWSPSDRVFLNALDQDFAYATGAGPTGLGEIHAYSANGTDRCAGTPKQCEPVWIAPVVAGPVPPRGPVAPSGPVVDGGMVFVSATANGTTQLFAYDRNGIDACADGTPRVCLPLGILTLSTDPNMSVGALAVSDGNVYWTGMSAGAALTLGVHASELVGCRAPGACAPFMTVHTQGWPGNPIVAGGRLYVGTDLGAAMFDAAGVAGCSGGTCLRLATFPGTDTSRLIVANGRLHARFGAELGVFDAAGFEGCAEVPAICEPLWSTDNGVQSPVSVQFVTDDLVVIFVALATSGEFRAFDARGNQGCSGTGLARRCPPLWHIRTQTTLGAAIGAGGIGLAGLPASGGPPQTLVAFRLDGAGCDPATHECPTIIERGQMPGSPSAVAFGRVVLSSGWSELYGVD